MFDYEWFNAEIKELCSKIDQLQTVLYFCLPEKKYADKIT
ncbi:Hypothetical protein I595_2080 [Croceitalea dokdonensis DOKDO 023]|uniref:Uncharacterized protein n=1 Tax=Croceitalea dokdonensis DOKDO 023 TaxID=1300341 RepID=A0A0P7AUR8_9FLAO|nr:Hypothetical protein I595_2080 [Croceitalea dokdonensis DOKDO 023]